MPCSPTVDLMGLQYIFSVAYILARKHHLMKIIIVISGKKLLCILYSLVKTRTISAVFRHLNLSKWFLNYL